MIKSDSTSSTNSSPDRLKAELRTSSLVDEDGVERSRTVVLIEQAASLGMRWEDLDVFLQAGFSVEDVCPATIIPPADDN